MFNKWNKTKSYLINKIAPTAGGGMPSFNPLQIFISVGLKVLGFLSKPAVQIGLFVAQGVASHRAAKKLEKEGAEILLQKYGSGGAMPVIYGTRRVGSTVVYMNTINNRELFVVYAIAGHEIDSFDLESIQLDGRTVKDSNIYRQGYDISDGTTRIKFRSGAGTVTSGAFWGNTSAERANITGQANTADNARMTFNCHTGTNTQAADPMLEGIIDGWTSNHKLSGIAYIAANYEYDTLGMFTGIPNLTVVVNGKKVFDPRTSTTAFSDNAALCLLDYLTDDDYGKGLSRDPSTGVIDLSSFSTAANACEATAATITHSSVIVTRASTTTDVVEIKKANETDFNNFKVGNEFTIDDGVTTYVNAKKLVDKDITLIDLDGTSPEATLRLKFEDGAVGTAITSDTTCTFTEAQIRFHCNGVVDTNQTVLSNTQLLVSNMRGIFNYSEGKYAIKVEGTESSVVTLDEDDILESGLTLSLENKESKYNKVEAEFANAQKRYATDTATYTGETSDTFLADDGNELLEHRIDLPFTTNQRIAYNHAKAALSRSRSQKAVSFVATPKVLQAKVGEVISITNSNMNLSAEQYRITNMVMQPDLNIQVNAIEYQSAVYDYVTPPDEPIGISDDPVIANRVIAPTGLTFTEKNTSTGEAAKLTWTDSTKYPSYEFRVQIIDSASKTRFDGRVKDEYFYLDGISVDTGYTAKVSAVNTLGIESDTTDLVLNVTVAPIHTPDIGQGSIGGFNFTATKMYYGTAGNFNNTDTAVYFDNTGQFSLKDKLSWNGTTLNISGNLTVENTISADKILLDGINLDTLLSATDQASSNYLTTFSGAVNISSGGSGSGYPAELQLQATNFTNAIGSLQQAQTQLNIRARNNASNGGIAFQGFNGTAVSTYGSFDAAGDMTFNNDVTVTGDLVVNGTTVTLNTATLDVEDKNITLNYSTGDSSSTANGAGITIQDAVNSTTDATILWDGTNDEFDFSHTVDIPTLKLNGTTVIDSSSNLTNISTISSKDITITQNSDAATNLTLKRNSATGRSQFALANESGTQLWRVGLTGAGSEDFVFYDGGANVLVLDRSSDSANFAGDIRADGNYKIGANTIAEQVSTTLKFGDRDDNDYILDLSGFSEQSQIVLNDGFMTFSTGGSERARFNSSGSLGIGTTSPDSSAVLTLQDADFAGLYMNLSDASGTSIVDIRGAVSGTEKFRLGKLSSSSDDFSIRTGGSTALTIDTSQRVGIGTSPSSEFHVSSAAPVITATATNTVSGLRLNVVGGGNELFRIQDNGTTRLTIDSAGEVGIGVTPSAEFHVKGNGQIVRLESTSATGNNYLSYYDSSALKGHVGYTGGSDNDFNIYNAESSNFKLFTSGSERLRVDSSGNLLVSKSTTSVGTAGVAISSSQGVRSTVSGNVPLLLNRLSNTGNIVDFRQAGTVVGTITVTSSSTAYNTSSDARLKDDIGDIDGLNIVEKLNPRKFSWKTDGQEDIGLYAQEVMHIVPNAVSENEEGYYQMDYSKLVTPLIKAIQEQQKQIEELKKQAHPCKELHEFDAYPELINKIEALQEQINKL